MQFKTLHFGWSIVGITTYPKPSGGNHDRSSPEDAAMKPPRVLLLDLGGFVVQGTISLSHRGIEAEP
jgi:hypothetical protein